MPGSRYLRAWEFPTLGDHMKKGKAEREKKRKRNDHISVLARPHIRYVVSDLDWDITFGEVDIEVTEWFNSLRCDILLGCCAMHTIE